MRPSMLQAGCKGRPSDDAKDLAGSEWFFGAQLDQPSGEAPARPNWRPERKMRTRMVDVTESARRCEAEASGSAHLPSGYLARLI